MARTIVDCVDAEQVSRVAADEFVRRAAEAIAKRDVFRVALAGGSTPKRTYELLAEPRLSRRIDWGSVHIFFGDERTVPPDDKDSNFHMANLALLSQVALPSGQVHRMAAERGDTVGAAREYASEIGRVFGIAPGGELPRFDLILLGMGKDGHTASLFPHTTALEEKRAWVVANDVPSMSTARMTLTAPVINAARCVMFQIAGPDKAEPLRSVLHGPREGRETRGEPHLRAGNLLPERCNDFPVSRPFAQGEVHELLSVGLLLRRVSERGDRHHEAAQQAVRHGPQRDRRGKGIWIAGELVERALEATISASLDSLDGGVGDATDDGELG